ncbi:hypothetical protein [Nonlabens agnitus]|uniref:Uncharacterized protein n=1 Tax=Nonlabens agnitus TaxID=870484 RepID=A0A2S9WVX4_9FLAO|nr:hypothetical protein [Nonlabens agnitus]PRP67637.1 hypothetical protein BST86_11315 [Nonlabens agnitus]
MSIRLGNSCGNCEHLSSEHKCGVHDVFVNAHYTCHSFSLKAKMEDDRGCTSCARYGKPSCPHSEKATAGMMCNSWAPEKVAV